MNIRSVWKRARGEMRYYRTVVLSLLAGMCLLFIFERFNGELAGALNIQIIYPLAVILAAATTSLKPDQERRGRLMQILPLSRDEALAGLVVKDLVFWLLFTAVFLAGLLAAQSFSPWQQLWQGLMYSGLALYTFAMWRFVSTLNYVGSSTWWKSLLLLALMVVMFLCFSASITSLDPEDWQEAGGAVPYMVNVMPAVSHLLALLLFTAARWLHRMRSDFTGKTEGTFLEGLGGMR